MTGYRSPLFLLALAWTGVVSSQTLTTEGVRITIDLRQGPIRTFVPEQSLGAGLDGHESGATRRLLHGTNLARMKEIGFGTFSYRLRTELGIQAWHWNPEGRFSGPDGRSGYWLSSATPGKSIETSYGYRLPRRGSSGDQANQDGYSRLDDGDPATLWKSNPYLDQHFTHEDNARHPQWVVIDLGELRPVDTLRIQWGDPFARVYRVEYCSNPHALDVEERICAPWTAFPSGQVDDGRGGEESRRLAPRPVQARFIRLLLLESSAAASGGDVRDHLGYAIRELGIGTTDTDGTLSDEIDHAKDVNHQTSILVSSTDPWHSVGDRDPGTEQPGLDLFYRSGFADQDPPLIPIPLLYDTPDNAAAEIAYLERQGYPVRQVEMGEEPDGQYVTPEDYGALYLQFADALHRVDPRLQLGGPGFQTAIDGYRSWPIGDETRHWMTRFLDYLRSHGREKDLSFFSFEWYPFDDCCGDTSLQLASHPRILSSVLDGLYADGLPRDLPWMITEYGYSAFACRPEVDIEGALLNAEIVGLALERGAERVFLYGLEPSELMDELGCNSWGNNALFVADDQLRIRSTTATYHGARMLNRDWVESPSAPHQIYPVRVEGSELFGLQRLSAFALRGPSGAWSLLLVNKNPSETYRLTTDFLTASGTIQASRAIGLTQFSRDQYHWKAAGDDSRPTLNLGPRVEPNPALPVALPPYSLTVLRLASPEAVH